MPKFVVRRSPNEKLFMKITEGEIWWTPFQVLANWYDSYYQAKKHIRSIVLPDTVVIEELERLKNAA